MKLLFLLKKENGKFNTPRTDIENTLINTTIFQNLTTQYRWIFNKINRRRISLAFLAATMQVAMSSLVHGYLPISLIPPTTLKEIITNFEFFPPEWRNPPEIDSSLLYIWDGQRYVFNGWRVKFVVRNPLKLGTWGKWSLYNHPISPANR